MNRAWLAVLGVLAACNGHLALVSDLESEDGEYLTYYTSYSLQPCGGNLAYADGFMPFIAGQLGIPARNDGSLMWLTPTELSRTFCGRAWGCQFRDFAFSYSSPVHLHELVHLAVDDAKMNRWAFFSEGLATAYDWGNGNDLGIRFIHTPVPGDPVFLADDPMLLTRDVIHYGAAGGFVTYLLAWHGPEKTVEFIQRLRGARTHRNLRRKFRDVFGLEFTDEVDRFNNLRNMPCPDDIWPVIPYDCAMPDVAWQGLDGPFPQFVYKGELDCSADNVVGGFSSDHAWPSFHGVTMEVPETVTYRVSLGSEPSPVDKELSVQIGPCFGCAWHPQDVYLVGPHKSQHVKLNAGKHFVRITGKSDEIPDFVIIIQRSLEPEAD